MFEPSLKFENALRFSRLDGEHLLASSSAHCIILEEQSWPSVEHYFQHKILSSDRQKSMVSGMADPLDVYHYAKPWYRRKVKNWKTLRRVLMTRALYTKAQMYDEVRTFLLETGDQVIAESSLYDYYWGIGRDLRGENMFGTIWMDVRSKLRDEFDDGQCDDQAPPKDINR